MKTAVCTISTHDHLFKSRTTLKSVSVYSSADLFCLLTDTNDPCSEKGIHFMTTSGLRSETAKKIIQKYTGDKLRWALKPIYIAYLLENGYDRVIYVDNDIFFFSSPNFIFNKLSDSTFLLTPHFYKTSLHAEQNWLEANYRVGLFNAGFIGANKAAVPILNWWAECCLYAIKKSYWRGLFDDQKYLDLIPVKFEGVEILKHRGCNFAGWNCDEVTLEMKEGQLYINEYPVVFIHFAQLSMERFSDPASPVYPLFKEYEAALKHYHPSYKFSGKKLTFSSFSTYFYYLRWKLSRLFEY